MQTAADVHVQHLFGRKRLIAEHRQESGPATGAGAAAAFLLHTKHSHRWASGHKQKSQTDSLPLWVA